MICMFIAGMLPCPGCSDSIVLLPVYGSATGCTAAALARVGSGVTIKAPPVAPPYNHGFVLTANNNK